jgi:NmrA-like family
MAPPKSVLVIGAGELGLAVLRSLARHPVRGDNKIGVLLRHSTIISNDPAKKDRIRKLLALNLSFESGDIEKDSAEQLASVFKDYDVVVGCSGMEGSSGVQLKLTKAAIAARVTRYIPWQFGVDYDILGRDSSQDLFDEQLDVRAALRSQESIEWVIISTGVFMSFLFEEIFGVVGEDRKIVRALGGWDNRVTVTDVEDIGKMTAEVVWAGEGIKNDIVFVAGDTISYGDLANAVEKHQASPSIEKVEWTVPYLKAELAKDPDNGIKKYRVVFAEGKGVAWDMSTTLNVKKGIQLQTVKQWLKK